MNDIEIEVYDELKEAETDMEIIEAVQRLEAEQKTVVAETLVSAAGTKLGEQI
jgi:hypothetical protein